MLEIESLTSRPSQPPTSPTTLLRRRSTEIVVAAALILVFLSHFSIGPRRGTYNPHTFKSSAANSHTEPTSQDAQEFWNLFSQILARAKPSFPSVNLTEGLGWLVYDANNPHVRKDTVHLSETDWQQLKGIHASVTTDVRQLASRTPFKRGTRGIVTSANNDALTVFTTSLRMLRLVGSKLPVEIFIDKYEAAPCEIIFPSLGARCVFISDLVPELDHPIRLKHFGYKAAAVLFSSFEQVLYLDSDLFPVENPDILFEQQPFASIGFVLWPDYWSNTASPKYYDIANVVMPNMSSRASTESGAFLLDKATHSAAALLAFYYNHYGDGYYYPLLSQGANGYGDKETWLAATQAFDLSFYQVYEPPTRLGYRCGQLEHAVASLQHHPYEDWFNVQQGVYRGYKTFLSDAPEPRVMFVHGNLPKYDASYVFDWHAPQLDWTDMLRCDNNTGQPHRFWGPKEFTLRKFGWDVEKSVWDAMRWTACEHEQDYMMWWNGTDHSAPQVDLCKRVMAWYEELLPNETYTKELTPPKREWRI